MAKFEKYFLAIVPEGDNQRLITSLKENIKAEFDVKYALKSPAHVTLKMPFSYNERKEDRLIQQLQDFLNSKTGFEIKLEGIFSFGMRVIYIGVEQKQTLLDLQSSLLAFCKKELKLIEELSDKNYHPHLTIAFKDFKKDQMPNIIHLSRLAKISQRLDIVQICLLKRVDYQWVILKRLPINSR
jgi:2'-5' RNA ligase